MKDKTTSPHLNQRDFLKIITPFLGSVIGVQIGLPIIGNIISAAIKVQEVDDWILLALLDDSFDGHFDFVAASPKTNHGEQIDFDRHSKMAIFSLT